MSDGKTRVVNYGDDIESLRKEVKALKEELAELRGVVGNVYAVGTWVGRPPGSFPKPIECFPVRIDGVPMNYKLEDK